MTDQPRFHQVSRRAFLKNGTLLIAAPTVAASMVRGSPISTPALESTVVNKMANPAHNPPELHIGLVTDLHYADKPPAGSRYYRQTPDKLAEAAAEFARHDLSFLVELGDLIDAAESVDTEIEYLTHINRDFAAICENRHYVLGNHCVQTLTKPEFLGAVGQQQSYYSFDAGGFHFVILDACFREDGQAYGRNNFVWTDANIPAQELDWLESDLRETSSPTIVFAHQRLDVDTRYGVRNGEDVRRVLEASEKVLVVLQGHNHVNDVREMGGIHYCTLTAMVEGSGEENNGYSIMSIADGGSIRITGFRKQAAWEWPR